MKQIFVFAFALILINIASAQTNSENLLSISKDGNFTLNPKGVEYFTNLSLECVKREFPHDYQSFGVYKIESMADLKSPKEFTPSFYGCFDWHSAVHNHWALVKMLKAYPNAPTAKAIRQRLNISFHKDSIAKEIQFFENGGIEKGFEFPYGQAWLLKVADELNGWSDADAKKWLDNINPLAKVIANFFAAVYPNMEKARYTGNHYSSALGLMFAYDYAKSFKQDSLLNVVSSSAKRYYSTISDFPFGKEPFDYDFMSAGLLIAEAMRRVLPQNEFATWIKKFSPDMFTKEGIEKVFYIKVEEKHDEYESHWDGFHLNRIWCMNGLIKALPATLLTPELKLLWRKKQMAMWKYSQASIGKGNYDIDHWLSSFSVYAAEGN
jgi:hypothetical protein